MKELELVSVQKCAHGLPHYSHWLLPSRRSAPHSDAPPSEAALAHRAALTLWSYFNGPR